MSRPPPEVVDLPAEVGEAWEAANRPAWLSAVVRVDPGDRDLPPALAALARQARGRTRLGRSLRRLAAQLPGQVPDGSLPGGSDTALRQALAGTAFVVWHRGRWFQNLRLPLSVVEQCLSRVEQALAAARTQREDLAAGIALLGELEATGRADEAGRARREVEAGLVEAEARTARLVAMRRELVAARDELRGMLDRRRRAPTRSATRLAWTLAVDDLVRRARLASE